MWLAAARSVSISESKDNDTRSLAARDRENVTEIQIVGKHKSLRSRSPKEK